MNNNAIGIFDSGIGGLTVLKEIIVKLSKEEFIYLGDTKRFPYGNKTKETIIENTKQAIDFLLSKNVKAIVIACGTATSQALEEVKVMCNVPIIGIIQPTVEFLFKQSQIKDIGVIATTGTIRSKEWEIELKKANSKFNIVSRACPLLAPMAEEGWIDNDIAKLAIKEYLKGITEVDKLVLGCTHYPFFIPLIEKEINNKDKIIDTGKILAEYLKNFLKKEKMLSNRENVNYEFYLTDLESNFKNIANKFINKEIKFEKVEL